MISGMAFRLAIVGLLAISSQTVLAQGSDPKSGMHWLRKCSNPEAIWLIECAVYLRAIVEYDEVRATALGQDRFICPARDVAVRESREVVIKFLRERPRELHRPFALLAHRALETAFPCSVSSKPGVKP